MEVRKGYKQTEVGIIPEDWAIKPLSALTKEIGDGIHATPEYVDTSEYYFINGNNLLNGRVLITLVSPK
jgi:type I restriction enzyme S subunit